MTYCLRYKVANCRAVRRVPEKQSRLSQQIIFSSLSLVMSIDLGGRHCPSIYMTRIVSHDLQFSGHCSIRYEPFGTELIP